jgi:hypothetical protein
MAMSYMRVDVFWLIPSLPTYLRIAPISTKEKMESSVRISTRAKKMLLKILRNIDAQTM